LEDLHWSDYATLDLVAWLARRQEPARLLLLGTYRPVEVLTREHPLRGVQQALQLHGHCAELPLAFLSEAAVAAYLTRRLAGYQEPAALARIIHQRTDGNPLFMVHVVEELLTQGRIVEQQGGWVLHTTPDAEVVQTPEGVVPSLVRLEAVDHFYGTRMHSLYYSRRLGFVFGRTLAKRESGALESNFALGSRIDNSLGFCPGSLPVSLDKLPSQVVETAPQVVDSVPSDQSEICGRLLSDLNVKYKLTGLLVLIAQKSIWVALSKDLDARFKIMDVVFGPVNLRPDTD